MYEHKLRPEFVRLYKARLSSDAFLASGSDPKTDEREVQEASDYLRSHVIPAFVQKLDQLVILPMDSRGLAMEMHQHGINMRYLSMYYKKGI